MLKFCVKWKMLVIDATDCVMGRLASYVAKKALNGEEVIVVNAEKSIISGKRKSIIEEELKKLEIRNLGNPRKGPFHQKRPDRYLRRVIRGMLPYKQPRGREAFRRIQVYIGVPEKEIERRHNIKLKDVKIISLEEAKKKFENYIRLGELCKAIGGT